VATTLQHSSFKSNKREVWILEKIEVVTSQHSSLRSSEKIADYPKQHHQGHQS
jgi:hypothetical protein